MGRRVAGGRWWVAGVTCRVPRVRCRVSRVLLWLGPLLAALWLQNRVVRVPVTFDGDNASGTPEPFITNLENPQHLLPLPDGSLLLSDFGANTLYRIDN